MNEEQFVVLMAKLKEIHNSMKASERTVRDTFVDYNKFRNAFFHGLEFKTGWGRNEIKQLFEEVLEELN